MRGLEFDKTLDILRMQYEYEMLTSWQLPWTLAHPVAITGLSERERANDCHILTTLKGVRRNVDEHGVWIVFDTELGELTTDDVNVEDLGWIMDRYNEEHCE